MKRRQERPTSNHLFHRSGFDLELFLIDYVIKRTCINALRRLLCVFIFLKWMRARLLKTAINRKTRKIDKSKNEDQKAKSLLNIFRRKLDIDLSLALCPCGAACILRF